MIANQSTMKKHLKTKMKSYEGEVKINFHGNGIPKKGSYYTFFSMIVIDFVYKKDKNYYLQLFLEE